MLMNLVCTEDVIEFKLYILKETVLASFFSGS